MLQALLEERFALKVRHTPQERSIYALVVAKGGPKFSANTGDEFKIVRQGRRQIRFQKVSMAMMARALSGPYHSDELDRAVVDRTALTGEFDLTLDWAPGFTRKGAVDTLVIEHVGRPSEN